MVRFMPIWTATATPPTSIVVLPFRYHPNEPVENSLTSAWSGTSPILMPIGFALVRKSVRLMGQIVFLAIGGLLDSVLQRMQRSATGYHTTTPWVFGKAGWAARKREARRSKGGR